MQIIMNTSVNFPELLKTVGLGTTHLIKYKQYQIVYRCPTTHFEFYRVC